MSPLNDPAAFPFPKRSYITVESWVRFAAMFQALSRDCLICRSVHLICYICTIKICRCYQTAVRNSCSIASGDVWNCSYRLKALPTSHEFASQFSLVIFYTRMRRSRSIDRQRHLFLDRLECVARVTCLVNINAHSLEKCTCLTQIRLTWLSIHRSIVAFHYARMQVMFRAFHCIVPVTFVVRSIIKQYRFSFSRFFAFFPFLLLVLCTSLSLSLHIRPTDIANKPTCLRWWGRRITNDDDESPSMLTNHKRWRRITNDADESPMMLHDESPMMLTNHQWCCIMNHPWWRRITNDAAWWITNDDDESPMMLTNTNDAALWITNDDDESPMMLHDESPMMTTNHQWCCMMNHQRWRRMLFHARFSA